MIDSMEFAPAPVEATDNNSETPTEEPPKRRGRPPGSKNQPRDPNAPKRTYTRRKGKASLQENIGQTLLLANFAFGFVPPPWDQDALTEQEIEALSHALDRYAQDHATVYKYLDMLVGGAGSSTTELLLVIASMANRRMNNHGVTLASLMGFGKPEAIEIPPEPFEPESVVYETV
jgi:hypothetical protein